MVHLFFLFSPITSENIVGVLPKYFSSEWSFAQFRLPESTKFIVAFGSQNTVLIAGMDGRYAVCHHLTVKCELVYCVHSLCFSKIESLIFDIFNKVEVHMI
jgi:hypothetical protein